MSTETTIGEKLRELRESKELPLRKVSALLDIDVAILSKMERGERKLAKDIVLKLADIYGHNADELLVLFLSDKIMYEIQDEDLGEKALKVAEQRVKYLKAKQEKMTIKQLIEKYQSDRNYYLTNKYNETLLRSDFLDPFFELLGWDIKNNAGKPTNEREVILEEALKANASENSKKPDYTFRLFSERKFFLEAKKPCCKN
jgi:transcriptional regulator with XRE-family HTH domain